LASARRLLVDFRGTDVSARPGCRCGSFPGCRAPLRTEPRALGILSTHCARLDSPSHVAPALSGCFPGFPATRPRRGDHFLRQGTAIGRPTASSGQYPASTTVTFQVERALRGTSPGKTLTIHEWAGLWTSGERYYVGERVLLFLYSPGKLGLSSPVAGAMGRFAMDSQGRIVMSPQHIVTLTADPILGGKTVVSYTDFAQAVRRSSGEE